MVSPSVTRTNSKFMLFNIVAISGGPVERWIRTFVVRDSSPSGRRKFCWEAIALLISHWLFLVRKRTLNGNLEATFKRSPTKATTTSRAIAHKTSHHIKSDRPQKQSLHQERSLAEAITTSRAIAHKTHYPIKSDRPIWGRRSSDRKWGMVPIHVKMGGIF